MPTIMQELSDGNVDWRDYYESLPGPAIFLGTFSMYLDQASVVSRVLRRRGGGQLGQVNFVDANLADNAFDSRDDFHPPGDMQSGEAFMHDVVDAVMKSPQWPHAAIILTFDEHGGIYDHVPPPPACAPDGIAPILSPPAIAPGDFKTYGVRVPLIVVSPYAKPHFVSHAVYDHTSILRFIESRFKLPALTARDANADPLTDMFDFSTRRLRHAADAAGRAARPLKSTPTASRSIPTTAASTVASRRRGGATTIDICATIVRARSADDRRDGAARSSPCWRRASR